MFYLNIIQILIAFLLYIYFFIPVYNRQRKKKQLKLFNGTFVYLQDYKSSIHSNYMYCNQWTYFYTMYLFIFQKCDDLILLHLGYLDYYRYIITIHFYGLEGSKFHFSDIIFHVRIAWLSKILIISYCIHV